MPPATFAACDGTMNGSPAALCRAVYGSAESADTVGMGAPVIWKSSAVWSIISFSIQDPDGYSSADWSLLHCAWAAVKTVPDPPG